MVGDYFTTYKNEKMVGIYIIPDGIEKEIQKLENFHSRVMYFSVSRRASQWPSTISRVNSVSQYVTRVNSANVLDEGLRIGEIGRRMNSKVKLVEISVYRK
jgi:hypothetical protein